MDIKKIMEALKRKIIRSCRDRVDKLIDTHVWNGPKPLSTGNAEKYLMEYVRNEVQDYVLSISMDNNVIQKATWKVDDVLLGITADFKRNRLRFRGAEVIITNMTVEAMPEPVRAPVSRNSRS